MPLSKSVNRLDFTFEKVQLWRAAQPLKLQELSISFSVGSITILRIPKKLSNEILFFFEMSWSIFIVRAHLRPLPTHDDDDDDGRARTMKIDQDI